jgi:RNA polymerase sigma-70 factor (ECF subfamily)
MDGDEGPMAATTSVLSPPALGEALATETPEERTREERFAAFVVSHRDRARRLAWRLVGGDEGAAEDVCQDAFVKAYRALDRFRGDSSIETWFYRILVRQAHNHRRWRAVRERWGAVTDAEPRDPSPVGQGDPGLRRRIAEALSQLTRRQREAFVLVHLEGFTVSECAALLGKPTGTVKSHLHRALKSLRSELSDLRGSLGGHRS